MSYIRRIYTGSFGAPEGYHRIDVLLTTAKYAKSITTPELIDWMIASGIRPTDVCYDLIHPANEELRALHIDLHRFLGTWPPIDPQLIHSLFFENSKDAMMFKLRFGGDQ